MIKACIFDLDGVIVDTAKYHYLAWCRIAEELGFNFSKEENEKLKGVSRMKSLEILLSCGGVTLTEEQKLETAARKNSYYLEYIEKIDRSELLPGVEEILSELRKNGIKTGIGSASKNTWIILINTGIKDMFDAVVDGNMVSKAKPDPEVFVKCAELLCTDSSECVVFEDSQAGIEAANASGMHSVGIGSADILKGAQKVISGFKNIDMDIIFKGL